MASNDDQGARSAAASRRTHPVPPAVRRSLKETAEAVETWRKLRGLTQAQLADRAGVGRRTIIRLEGGDGGVTVENLLRVLRALGLLDALPRALDPYESDIGRLRADEQLPQRVRPRSLRGDRTA
jgi:transcriptional regulator with XRE-family HTH domain